MSGSAALQDCGSAEAIPFSTGRATDDTDNQISLTLIWKSFFELSLDFLCSLHIKAKVALPTETHDVRSSNIVETMNCAITTHIKDALKEPQKLS